jgi:hypothetical protein
VTNCRPPRRTPKNILTPCRQLFAAMPLPAPCFTRCDVSPPAMSHRRAPPGAMFYPTLRTTRRHVRPSGACRRWHAKPVCLQWACSAFWRPARSCPSRPRRPNSLAIRTSRPNSGATGFYPHLSARASSGRPAPPSRQCHWPLSPSAGQGLDVSVPFYFFQCSRKK